MGVGVGWRGRELEGRELAWWELEGTDW